MDRGASSPVPSDGNADVPTTTITPGLPNIHINLNATAQNQTPTPPRSEPLSSPRNIPSMASKWQKPKPPIQVLHDRKTWWWMMNWEWWLVYDKVSVKSPNRLIHDINPIVTKDPARWLAGAWTVHLASVFKDIWTTYCLDLESSISPFKSRDLQYTQYTWFRNRWEW